MDSSPPPSESRRVDYGIAGVAALIVLLLLCAGGGGLVWLAMNFMSGEEPPPPPTPPSQTTQPDAGRVAETTRDDTQQMRARYRPGPYATVVGLLPAGLSSLRRLATDQRQARTIDTPWIVPGAELRPVAPSSQSAGGPGLRLPPNTNGAVTVIPGAPTYLEIIASPGSGADGSVQGLEISFDGYPGTFFLPAVVDSELGTIRVSGVDRAEIQFGIDAPITPGGDPAPPDKEMIATIRIAAVDIAGRVSESVTRRLRVMPTGTGDVEVSLNMSEATDLDLYVVDPSGVVIYYGNTNAFSGGHLDLDANAGCGSNLGVNNEHIYWPAGRAPAGTYHVRVANFQSCISGREVNYRITVRNCGETAVLRGSFTGNGDSTTCDRDPGSNRAWCQHVVSFDVTPCDQP